jgi:hypothetical protein
VQAVGSGVAPAGERHGGSQFLVPISEALATVEAFELGADTGCPVHILHASIARIPIGGRLSRARPCRLHRGLHSLSDAR